MRQASIRSSIVVSALVIGLGVSAAGGRAEAATVYGLAGGGNFLVRFAGDAPGVIIDAAAITGLQPGERIAGIDFRPRTGQLYGLGVISGPSDTVRVYVVDPASGVATIVPGSTSFTVTTGGAYGIGFNPTVDRLRVVNTGNENFRINPNNGARADTPTNDTDISPGTPSISAVAYDRGFDTGLAVANRTTLYGLSFTNDSLVTIGGINQSPSPNGGATTTVGSTGVVSSTIDLGFDIDLDSSAFAAINVGLENRLYRLSLATGAATLVGAIGGGNLGVGGIAVVPPSVVAVGTDGGTLGGVRVLDAETQAPLFDFAPYDAKYKKGVRLALGDVTLDSVPEIIVAPGKGGGTTVKVFDGATGQPLPGAIGSFDAFDPTVVKGGVWVASGDVNGDGFKDVIAGSGEGSAPAHVRLFNGATGDTLAEIDPFDAAFKGGVRVAAADFDLDGDYEVVTAAGKGGGARVRVFAGNGDPFVSASLPSFVNDFEAYGPDVKADVFVAAGDVNGDGRPDIVTGVGKGGRPEVAVFSGTDGAELQRFLAFEPKVKSGVRVALADVDGDGRLDVLAAPGSGKGTQVRAFDGRTGEEKTRFLAFDPAYKKGVFVAGVRR